MAALDDWDAAEKDFQGVLVSKNGLITRKIRVVSYETPETFTKEDFHQWQYAPAARSGAGPDELTTAIYRDLDAIGKYANAKGFSSEKEDKALENAVIALLSDSNAAKIFYDTQFNGDRLLKNLSIYGVNKDNIGILTGHDYANRADSLSSRQAYYIANATRASGGLRSQGTG